MSVGGSGTDYCLESRSHWVQTDLFTCCPPGPLDLAKVVVPLGRASSLKAWRHFLASARSSGSNEASKAWYLANLFHGTSCMAGGRVRGAEMRQGILVRDLVIIVESLYKGRMKAIRFGEDEIGSQEQITADGTDACMYLKYTALADAPSKPINRDARCSGLVIRAEQSLVFKPRKKKEKKEEDNPF